MIIFVKNFVHTHFAAIYMFLSWTSVTIGVLVFSRWLSGQDKTEGNDELALETSEEDYYEK